MSDAYKIYGSKVHPNQEGLKTYGYEAPVGVWQGRLDEKTWGQSTNLFCYFTDMASGVKRRISVFSRNNYAPYQEGPNFKYEDIGSQYEITTGVSAKNSLPTFLKAVKQK